MARCKPWWERKAGLAGGRLVVRASPTVAYQYRGHCYLRDRVIVIEGNTIAHVRRRFAGR
jgi:hypothetical protein